MLLAQCKGVQSFYTQQQQGVITQVYTTNIVQTNTKQYHRSVLDMMITNTTRTANR